LITASNVLNQRLGVLFYGYDSAFTPFQASLICIAPPLKRTGLQIGVAPRAAPIAPGTLSTDFNARIPGRRRPRTRLGRDDSARWFSRDLHDPAGFSTSLTNAIRFVICP